MTKVEGYLLNPDHPTGRGKAAFFARFGFLPADALAFAVALDRHGATRPVVRVTVSDFGRKHEVRCGLDGLDGRNPCIVTIWFQSHGEHGCRLVTAYPSQN